MSQTTHEDPKHFPSLVGPILLIGIGVILLLQNLGMIPAGSWLLAARFWPLALILIGIDIILGRRSIIGTILSGLAAIAVVGGVILIMLFPGAAGINRFIQPIELVEQRLEVPLDDAETANVTIDWYIGKNVLTALPASSRSAFVADVKSYGELDFNTTNTGNRLEIELGRQPSMNFGMAWPQDVAWEVGLHPELLYNLYLDAGVGSNEFDLSALRLNILEIDQGAGATRLSLPSGSYRVEIDGGAGAIDLELPSGVAAQIELDSGAGAFNPGPELELAQGSWQKDGTWETAAFSSSVDAIRISIDQGAGAINVSVRP
jgi:hypothetical protein